MAVRGEYECFECHLVSSLVFDQPHLHLHTRTCLLPAWLTKTLCLEDLSLGKIAVRVCFPAVIELARRSQMIECEDLYSVGGKREIWSSLCG